MSTTAMPQATQPPAPAPVVQAGTSVTTTAVGSLSTAAVGSLIIYAIRCWEAGKIEVPSAEIAMTMAAFLAPIYHAICKVVYAKLGLGSSSGPTP